MMRDIQSKNFHSVSPPAPPPSVHTSDHRVNQVEHVDVEAELLQLGAGEGHGVRIGK